MSHAGDLRLRVLGVSCAGPRLVTAVARGGGMGVLDSAGLTIGELRRFARSVRAPFGVRITEGGPNPIAGERLNWADEVHDWGVSVVVLGRGIPLFPLSSSAGGPRVLAEVATVAEGAAAVDAGVFGLIARDDGELSAFVLLQQLLAAFGDDVPVWSCGVGPRTAVAAMAGGAAGVLLDSQLALFPEADTDARTRRELSRTDSSLAPLFADRFPDAETAVRNILGSFVELPTTSPVEQGAPLCRTLGTALPIVQGPMTRVSDQPGFAAAVADHGGFPFVAVATADGPRTAELLTRTADRLGDRPWGAGILGFVADGLREQQLAAVRAARPRCVLIAGGRPAQAKALEADGIATYVHVPSPILLRQFLDAGIRRFVFEGSECGGHVGPRSSFVLWEQQLDVLLGHGPGLEVLFAGGVHDARSAAMVAAMAAPLAAEGAGVGVLMGTAYLFTEEAVAQGAITRLFQDQTIGAVSTVTLETAPGHRTRCLPSPYTGEFESVKEALHGQGVSPQDAWQRLEELNTGRLRIASKGVRRTDGGYVDVDEQTQLDQGMYMAGQVAVLRAARTSIAALHHEVTDGAADILRARESAAAPDWSATDRDVAIVGMACAFPGAPDLPTFWSNVLRGVDAVTEVPPDRWDPDVHAGRSASRWGGFLPALDFDPLGYGIPPASLGSIDPAQLVSLEIARRALDDAGYAERRFDRERTSVIFGAEAGGDLANAGVLRALLPGYLEDVPAELLDQLPELTEDSFPGTLANVISGRIANRLDLGGANYTVDAACGSSLAALDLAVKELRTGTSSMVLCGAVDLHNGINDYLMFTSAGALSPTGRSRPFDAAADGIALGEGVACLVLKRLADARQAGDRIYAVVKGVGTASDGKAVGLTAPRPDGQRRALERAYHDAGVAPADVRMVEAHGTGTAVGDATELTTLTEFFSAEGALPGTVALGSVKSQIGHTKCAAGLAGVIKATLALWHEVVPPTLHLSRPNPAWRAESSPFTFTTTARPAPGIGRLAGVSAFGFGGTNFHAVLAAGPVPPDRRHGLRDWDTELLLFRGSDVDSARAALAALLKRLSGRPLRELAAAAAAVADEDAAPVQLAVVASDVADLAAAATAGGITADGAQPGKVAFLFPGQGSQRTGMLAELFVHFPELADLLRLAPDIATAVFPPQAFDPEHTAAQDEALRDTTVAQPALGLVESAVCRLLADVGVRPDFLAGHSYGELVALSVAGAFDTATLLALSRARADAIAAAAGADPGAMAAVRTTREQLPTDLLGPDVVLANHNAPEQVVVSGPSAALDDAVRRLRERGIAAKRIPVACAFHSPVVGAAADVFAADLRAADIQEPGLPVWSNRTGSPYRAGSVRAELAAQLAAPVRFVDQIEDMYAEGARLFVEVGPGRVLARLIGEILGDRQHTVVNCEPGLRGFLTALARLAVAGVDVRVERLFRGRVRPAGPKVPTWTVDGQLVRESDGRIPANGLAPARRLPRTSMNQPAPAGRDQAVVEFLRTSRELVAAQRDVMLSYLGAAGAVPATVPVVTAPPVVPAQIAVPSVAPSEPPPSVHAETADVLTSVLTVISERTGFPADMLDGDLDLEADLSIDSIKRTEIAGTLLTRLGLAGRIGDRGPDLLVRDRTVNALTATLRQWLTPDAEPATLDAEPAIPDVELATPAGRTPGRYLFRRVGTPLGALEPARVRGRTVAVCHAPEQAELAESVLTAFADAGAHAAQAAAADIVICVDAMAPSDEPLAPRLFGLVKATRGTLIVAARAGAEQAVGLAGLVRAAARERDAGTRLVVLESTAEAGRILLDEALTGEGPSVVWYDTDGRHTSEPVAADLGSIAYAGAGPGNGDLAALGLGHDSVVLLVGGARGITARAAVALAASGCRIELAGRTTWPGPPDSDLPGDASALRAALAARGGTVADTERLVRTVLAQREIGRTVDEIRAVGGEVNYHRVDVRDDAAFRQVVKDVHARYGRIDGVVYGAGVIDDKVMADKDELSFRTVFGTKVDGARTLLDALVELGIRPGFVTFFGSIAAVLGNRGQTDYAAANDAVAALGESWAARTGCRTLTVHWGPWAPDERFGGMVSPELAREYERRGVAMIDPDEGTSALLRELAYGAPEVRSVLYTASLW